MRGKLLLLGVAFLLASANFVFAQGTVKGKVTDKKAGETMAGVRILLISKDTDRPVGGAVTNKSGDYQIEGVKAGKYTLRAQYVGYKAINEDISVDAGSTIEKNFPLLLDVRGLDEVVVTGIASRTSKAVAEVAVGRVNAAEVTDKVGFSTAGQLLSGKIAGVTISPASGQVGGGLRFNVRSGAGLLGGGQSNPLIFIDGALVNGNNFTGIAAGGQQVSPLADLNPNDIESVEVLKGSAASALYGPQAQNGVVKITTKRGKASGGNEIQVNYQGMFGYNEPHRLYDASLIESWREANAILRQGRVQQHNVNLQGSSGVFNYFVGYENRDELGMLPQNSLNREAIRLNIDAVTSKNLTVRGSASYTRNKVNRPQNDNNVLGFLGNTVLNAPFTNPSGGAGGDLTIPNRAYRVQGVNSAFGSSYGFTDSAAVAAAENEALVDRFIGSAELVYNVPFIPGLTLSASGGTDLQSVRNVAFFPANFGYAGVVRGSRQIFNFTNAQTNFDANLTYKWNVGEDGFLQGTTILGGQAINVVNTNSFLSAQNYPTELVRDLGAGDATTRTISEGFQNTRILGVFARQEFSFLKELARISGGVRLDQASQYGREIPFVLYPQVSGMLRLDKLGFLPEIVNLAKLRVGYGQSGRLPTLLDAQSLLWTTAQSPSGAGAILNNAGNTAIAAERSAETEFGLEMEFDNAYGLEFTYYLQDTRGGLLNAPRPQSTGLGSKPINIGQINGWGFESKLSATFISTQETSLDVNLIVNYADNRVIDVGASAGSAEFQTDGTNMNYLIPGERRSQFMGLRPIRPRLRADGYYDYTNQPRIGIEIDTAGVRRLSNGTVVGYSLGSPIPLYTGSLNVTFRFLNDFTFYALGEFATGHIVLNDTRRFHTNPVYSNNPDFNRLATQLGIFGSGVAATNLAAAQERGPAAQIPTGRVPGVEVLRPGTPEYAAAANQFLALDFRPATLRVNNFAQPADWIRIRELSFTWNAARLLNSFLGEGAIRKLSFGASVTNLALFTRYQGIEPEITAAPGTALSAGQDFLTLMQARSVNFIVNFGL